MSDIKILLAHTNELDAPTLKHQLEKNNFEIITSKKALKNYYDSLYIKKNNVLIKIDLNDISHINIEGRYSEIVTNKGSYIVQKSLKNLAEILPASLFIRIHRNHMINTHKIDKIYLKDNLLILKNNIKLNVGNQYKQLFIEKNTILV